MNVDTSNLSDTFNVSGQNHFTPSSIPLKTRAEAYPFNAPDSYKGQHRCHCLDKKVSHCIHQAGNKRMKHTGLTIPAPIMVYIRKNDHQLFAKE